LRLQAERAGYRRRQQRLAQEAVQTERMALLNDMLVVADNLDRALDAADRNEKGLRALDALEEGVELTRSGLQRTLIKHGLERISVKGKPFDPNWHEAVYVVPAATLGVEPGTVVQVLEAGYRRQGTLFRPAKVVVAQ
jgi:molecular chaperone GrpE